MTPADRRASAAAVTAGARGATLAAVAVGAVLLAAGCRSSATADIPPGTAPPLPRIVAPRAGAVTGTLAGPGAPLRPRFVWEPVEAESGEAVSYDLEVDDECRPGAIVAARFASPEIHVTGIAETSWEPERDLVASADLPLGRRYCFHLRACVRNACSPWTRTRYVDVGRAAGDVNGDGFADVVIGAPLIDGGGVDRGSAFVYYGGAAGVAGATRLDEPDGEDQAGFGVAVAVGDLDGDRFDDVIVGAAGSDAARGCVFVFFGSPTGVSPGRRQVLRDPAGRIEDWYGAALAAIGDVDGDGYGDLAVGAPGVDSEGLDWGAVDVYPGGPGGPGGGGAGRGRWLSRPPRPPIRLGLAGPQDFDHFGAALSGRGDLDGDGYADLAVGVAGVDRAGGRRGNDRGAVHVFRGGPDGLSRVPAARLEAPVPLDHDRFGWAVAIADDLDGDGRDDLLIGAPSSDELEADTGLVYLYRGRPEVVSGTPDIVIADPGGDSFERFGTSVAGLGDVDGDGLGDFAVGTSAPDWGRAMVYRGDRERLGRAPALILREGNDPRASHRAGGVRDLRDFAQSVAGPGDLDGDGFDDLAVGAPGADNGGIFRGSALLYRGGRRGIDPATGQRLDDPDGGEHDHFGHVVAGQ